MWETFDKICGRVPILVQKCHFTCLYLSGAVHSRTLKYDDLTFLTKNAVRNYMFISTVLLQLTRTSEQEQYDTKKYQNPIKHPNIYF